MRFEPPHYEWSASTAYDAEKIVSAVAALLQAHMDTLVPDGMEQWDAKRAAPLKLKITLDLSAIVDQINARPAVGATTVGS